MSKLFINSGEYVEHPKYKGVYLKHFFDSKDSDRLNNFELIIIPGYEISLHIHEDTNEFFYFAEGCGEVFIENEWKSFKPGDAALAPIGHTHGIKNTSAYPIKIFAAFSPFLK